MKPRAPRCRYEEERSRKLGGPSLTAVAVLPTSRAIVSHSISGRQELMGMAGSGSEEKSAESRAHCTSCMQKLPKASKKRIGSGDVRKHQEALAKFEARALDDDAAARGEGLGAQRKRKSKANTGRGKPRPMLSQSLPVLR